MVLPRTFGLIAALVAPASAMPNKKEDNPVLYKRQGDPVPTVFGLTITLPVQPEQTSSAVPYESSGVDAGDNDDGIPTNLCAVTLCPANTICQVVEGAAQCLPATKCGPSLCGPGLVCCNESCGICTPPDGGCIMLWCGDFEKSA